MWGRGCRRELLRSRFAKYLLGALFSVSRMACGKVGNHVFHLWNRYPHMSRSSSQSRGAEYRPSFQP